MNLSQELERLARLHAQGALSADEFAKAKSRLLAQPGIAGLPMRGMRRRSARQIFGLPLWAIAIGPDWERGEIRGHARGIFAFGDLATGWFACGGLARGLIAVGGLAIGLVAFGGGAIGILVAAGGGAIGGLALGGGAVGAIAIGGGACGYYAFGGGTAGIHTVSALYQDPAALAFFQQYFPWVTTSLR